MYACMHKMYITYYIIIIIIAWYVIFHSVQNSHGQDLFSSASNVMSELTAGSTTLDDALSANVGSELQVILRN